MAKGELFFKRGSEWVDAYDTYGVSLETEGMSKLMTPAPHKEPVQNKNLAMNGTAIVGGVGYKDVKTLSLPMHLTAPTREDFLTRYALFCTEILDPGWIHIRTKYQRGVVYHFRYVDCQPFSEYNMKLAKYTLSLEEPNPTNRT
ncbi:MAG: hypothetical protein II826_09325 [Prevotella sp.]|nr:hypothetical protein [Prevotella sp.]